MSEPPPPVLRPMLPADLPAARALWAVAEGVELAEGDSEAELAGYLARNPGASHVAIEPASAQLVGAVLAGFDGRRGFLYHLAVAPTAQRTGLGSALVTHALAALRRAGAARVLILVDRENAAGRAFWIHRGWAPLTFAEPLGLDL